MLVEKYINELTRKNKQYKIKQLVKEYNKEVDFKLKSPVATKSFGVYWMSMLCILGGLTPLKLRSENISMIVASIYMIPSLIISIICMFLYAKYTNMKNVNAKSFLNVSKYIGFEFLSICFSLTYVIQFILFENWTSIDYLKTIGVFMVLLIPVIIVGIHNAPKKFIKQFSKDNDYKNPSEAVIWISITLVILANLTKPYMLILAVVYSTILYLTPKCILEVYKAKKYDYIQSLLK